MKCSKCGAQLNQMVWWMAALQVPAVASSFAPALQVCDHVPEYWPDELDQLGEQLAVAWYSLWRQFAPSLATMPSWDDLSNELQWSYVRTFKQMLLEAKVHP